jgi:hypothetical protein
VGDCDCVRSDLINYTSHSLTVYQLHVTQSPLILITRHTVTHTHTATSTLTTYIHTQSLTHSHTHTLTHHHHPSILPSSPSHHGSRSQEFVIPPSSLFRCIIQTTNPQNNVPRPHLPNSRSPPCYPPSNGVPPRYTQLCFMGELATFIIR